MDPIGASHDHEILPIRKVEGQEPESDDVFQPDPVALDDTWNKSPEDIVPEISAPLPPPEVFAPFSPPEVSAPLSPPEVLQAERPLSPVKIDNDDDDGWDADWGDEAAKPVAAEVGLSTDGDGWVDSKMAVQKQSSEEDGWDDDWGDMDSREEETINEEEEESPQPVPSPPPPPPPVVEEQPNMESLFSRLENKQSHSQWNWKSNFGLNLLANASKNVANLTVQVSQNLSTALDTSFVPQPEEMAKLVKEEERDTIPGPSRPKKLKNLVSGVTQISSKVITGGLDTLEGIGKKTIKIVQENKQFVMDLDRKGAEPEEPAKKPPKLPQFETIFDDFSGLVHLEALRLLSKQSQIKLEMLMRPIEGDELSKLQGTLADVEASCDQVLDISDDSSEGAHTPGQLEDRLICAIQDLDVEMRFDEVAQSWKRIQNALMREADNLSALEAYDKALKALAEFTALSIAKFQQLGNELIVCKYRSWQNESDALTR